MRKSLEEDGWEGIMREGRRYSPAKLLEKIKNVKHALTQRNIKKDELMDGLHNYGITSSGEFRDRVRRYVENS